MNYDVFISHASEDKEAVARPLAMHLQKLGLRVWLDECELTLGDSLRRRIDDGLACSRYGVVVLSPAFFSKEWPNRELDGLVAREDGGEKVILPIWHNVSASDVVRFSPILAAKIAISTSRGLLLVASTVSEAVQRVSGNAEDSASKLARIESESLEIIRRDMLTSHSSRDLRRSTYELEAHLARYPHSVEARELNDQLKVALLRAEAYESPGAGAPRRSAPPMQYARSAGGPIRWLVAVIAIGGLVYAALRYFGV